MISERNKYNKAIPYLSLDGINIKSKQIFHQDEMEITVHSRKVHLSYNDFKISLIQVMCNCTSHM